MSRSFLNCVLVTGLLLTATAGCKDTPELAAERERRRSPISVRGWIWDIEAPAVNRSDTLSVVNPAQAEFQRKQRLFADTNMSVENVTRASGGLLDTGAFIILDAPPRSLTVLFQAPVVGDHRLPMSNIPPNADVYLPGMIIGSEGIRFAEPEKIRVRVVGPESRRTGEMAQIGPHQVPIEEVTVAEMVDRRDYPAPEVPSNFQSAPASPAAPE